jgi:hypothetical protein
LHGDENHPLRQMRVASEEARRARDDGIEKGDYPLLRITKLIVVPVFNTIEEEASEKSRRSPPSKDR